MSGLVWISSYPKSGNTWIRALFAALRAGVDGAVDINRLETAQLAARETLDRLTGWKGAELLPPERAVLRLPVQEELARQAPGLLVKTHEVSTDPLDGRPLFSRAAMRCVVHVVRDPRDVAVSLSRQRGETLDEAIAFMAEPRASLGGRPGDLQETQLVCDWSTHVASWADAADLPVCALRYEDLLATPEATLARAAQAAGLPAGPERLKAAVAAAGFEELRRQEAERGFVERFAHRTFFREGRSGGWREALSAGQAARIADRHEAMMRRFGYLGKADALAPRP